MSQENLDMYEIVIYSVANPDIEGLYTAEDGTLMIDRRYTADAVARYGLSPRNADLGLIGPERVRVPENLIPTVDFLLNLGKDFE